jgi:hypothetical protein
MNYRFWDIENETEQIKRFTLFHSYVFEGEVYPTKEKIKVAKILIATWNRVNPSKWQYDLVEEE